MKTLGSLQVPRLVVVGAEDIPRPPHESHEMAKLMGCACVEVLDAGHIANLE